MEYAASSTHAGAGPDRSEGCRSDAGGGGAGDAELACRLMKADFALVEEDKVEGLEDWVRSLVSLDKKKTGVQYKKRHVEALLVHVRKVLTQVEAELQWELVAGAYCEEAVSVEKKEEEEKRRKARLSQLLDLVKNKGKVLEDKLGGVWKEVEALETTEKEKANGLKKNKVQEARLGWGAVLAEEGVEAAYEKVVSGALYTHGMSCQKCKQKKEKKEGDYCGEADCDQQVSLYKVMNTAMRLVGEWVEKKEEKDTPTKDVQLLLAFQPLVVRLLGLLRGLPKAPQVVFRGITLNLSPQYKVGGQKVWHSFSSTSLVKGEAQNFVAEGEQRGMMFAVATHTRAVDIDFANLYGERELLYAPNTVFNVAWKLSPTLLRMLGLQYDVVVLTEESGEGGADADAKAGQTELRLRALRDVVMHTVEFFDDFLSRYVEGRVETGRQGGAGKGQACLSTKVRAWLSGGMTGSNGARRPLCLLGGGGTGKTSAAVALMGWLLSGVRDGGGGPLHLEGTHSTSGRRPVFPVFVPLPVLRMKKRGLLAWGSLDEYVRESFGLTEEEQEQLREDYDVVLVLDSLDEVGVEARELLDAVKRQGLLSLHPWCASCSVVVTTRGEYLEAGGLVPADVCGYGTEALYLQPFTHHDVEAYVRKVLGAKDAAGAAAKTVPKVLQALENKALRGLVENPFVLHMAVAGRDSLPWMSSRGDSAPPAPVMRVQVYETYLRQAVKDGLARLKLKEPPPNEDILAVGELLGCWMLGSGTWAGTVNEARRWLREKIGAVAAGHLDVCLQCLPVRLESLEDEHGIFTFTHRTIGEYLAARRLWGAPRETLKKLLASRPFSKEAPNVLGFFAALRHQVICDEYKHKAGAVGRTRGEGADGCGATLGHLLELVQGSAAERTAQGDTCKEESKVVASNGMSLLCHGRYTLPPGTSLRGVVVCGADLRHLVLSGVDLTGAVLCDNWFDGSSFHSCNLTDTDWEGSSLGAILPPMKGHDGSVQAVAVTPDGRRVVSGSDDKTIRVWDLQTGKEELQLRGHNDCVTTLAVAPDGREVVSGSDDMTIRVWDLETGTEVIDPFRGHSDCITSLAVTPDGGKVVSGSHDMTIRVWDLYTGKEVIQALEGHRDCVTTLAVTRDGKKIVSGSTDKTIRVWDIKTGKKVMQALKGHSRGVTTLAVTRDGRKIVSGSTDKTIRVWGLEAGKKVMQPLERHSDMITTLAVTRDARRVVSGSTDKTIRVWDLDTGREVMQPLQGHSGSVTAVNVTPDARRVVSGSTDKTIRVWDLETGKEVVQAIQGHSDKVNTLAVTPDERRVVSGSDDVTIRVWDLRTGKEVMQPLEGHSERVNTLSVTPDGRWVVSGSDDETIRVWDLDTGKEVQALEGHSDRVATLAVTPDGLRVVSGSFDETIRVWDLKTGRQVMQPLQGHSSSVTTLAVTPDGRRVVSGSTDQTIRVWDLRSGKETMQPLKGHTSSVTMLSVTPDGQKVVSGSRDKTIRVWDLHTGKETIQPLIGHRCVVTTLAVTSDGRGVVSGSDDKTIRMWDLETGKEVTQPIEGHSDMITTLAVTRDGRRVVNGSTDKTIRVWDLDTHSSYVTPGGEKAKDNSGDIRVWDLDAASDKTGVSGSLLAVCGVGGAQISAVRCTGVESVHPFTKRMLFTC